MSIRLLLVFIIAAFCVDSSYASLQTGKIGYLRKRASDGLIYLALIGPDRSDKPACATVNYWMIRDENSTSGKQQYAMLLAAQLAGRSVTIWGANSCARWGDGEDIEMIQIND